MTSRTELSSPLVASVSAARIDSVDHPDYLHRVYAGVLGKLIGVYLGRPVENWSYERIAAEVGEVDYYIHEQRGRRLIVTDDDISGTFTFLRALEDYQYSEDLSPKQIGQTWLNYLIERTTILWWGGMGNSTEHTAYLRLKHGIAAPCSGSAELNSKVIAEQIGAQIFIDGWGLICPGDGRKAADFARRAARVSHDGEAIFGAQVIASLIANAFAEKNIDRLLDMSLELIPRDSVISRLITDLRSWHATGESWRESRKRLESNYGYDKYPGNCHIVPNHGVIILSLLHGGGDFDRSLMIVNTCGWDTDCNSGNLGTILGVLNGLEGLEAKDWRGPVADRLYIPSADGGRSISDAVIETYEVVNAARVLNRLNKLVPKNGERFHFSLPGSVQGWRAEDELTCGVRNACPPEEDFCALVIEKLGAGPEPAVASTPTFIPPDTKDMVTGYVLVANPTLYSGHRVRARLQAGISHAQGRLFIEHYGAEDDSVRVLGPEWKVDLGQTVDVEWQIPSTGGYPIHRIGIELDRGQVCLDSLDWHGVPETSWPPVEGTMWARAWAKSVDRFEFKRDGYEFLTHNEGVGMLSQGSRKWRDYRVDVRLTPRMAVAAGLAVRVQGLRRYYSFVFGARGEIRIDKALDGVRTLAVAAYDWDPFESYHVSVHAVGNTVRAFINHELAIEAVDDESPLEEGAFAFIVESGCLGAGTPGVSPL